MKKPTKAQLHARIVHYETALVSLLEELKEATSGDDISLTVNSILLNAPSLEPVVTADEPVAVNADDVGEEPATE